MAATAAHQFLLPERATSKSSCCLFHSELRDSVHNGSGTATAFMLWSTGSLRTEGILSCAMALNKEIAKNFERKKRAAAFTDGTLATPPPGRPKGGVGERVGSFNGTVSRKWDPFSAEQFIIARFVGRTLTCH
jgi:hypothetical protein